mmetsp:Transcript_1763/g.5280  ORF Transcript_1763/g.5280 Transcript_1763/m.5280 type:complete len:356 (+) Transcript_1763:121-1188(+)
MFKHSPETRRRSPERKVTPNWRRPADAKNARHAEHDAPPSLDSKVSLTNSMNINMTAIRSAARILLRQHPSPAQNADSRPSPPILRRRSRSGGSAGSKDLTADFVARMTPEEASSPLALPITAPRDEPSRLRPSPPSPIKLGLSASTAPNNAAVPPSPSMIAPPAALLRWHSRPPAVAIPNDDTSPEVHLPCPTSHARRDALLTCDPATCDPATPTPCPRAPTPRRRNLPSSRVASRTATHRLSTRPLRVRCQTATTKPSGSVGAWPSRRAWRGCCGRARARIRSASSSPTTRDRCSLRTARCCSLTREAPRCAAFAAPAGRSSRTRRPAPRGSRSRSRRASTSISSTPLPTRTR